MSKNIVLKTSIFIFKNLIGRLKYLVEIGYNKYLCYSTTFNNILFWLKISNFKKLAFKWYIVTNLIHNVPLSSIRFTSVLYDLYDVCYISNKLM